MAGALPKIGNKEKALIHVAKSQLGLSEDDYRAVLASVGAVSSKELNHVQFDEVMRRFKAGGFSGGRKRRPQPAAKDPRGPLLKKIVAILANSGLTDAYVDGMANKMFGVSSYVWLDQDQLWRIVAALSIYQKRKRNVAGPHPKSEGEKNGGHHERGTRGAGEAHAPGDNPVA